MINLQDWLNINEQNFLKISDILALGNEETIKVLCIDRNFYDCISKTPTENAIPAEDFFKDNYNVEYKQDHDLHGKIKFIGLDEEFRPFNFHLNFDNKSWYPLQDNGILPEEDIDGIMDFSNIALDFREYPTDTLIGWRGPMIKWEYVKNSPLIYWED